MTTISGALGIIIIMGISFSISRAGVAAGLAAVIFGQFLFGVIADSFGLGGIQPIPLDITADRWHSSHGPFSNFTASQKVKKNGRVCRSFQFFE